MFGGEVISQPVRWLSALFLAVYAATAAGAERITPVDSLPLLQQTFQFTATTEEESADVHFIIERLEAGGSKETILPPMIGRCSLQRGRNLVVVTLLPEKEETLFQLAVNGNGCGHRLIDKYPTDDDARAGAARRYAFLQKAGWSKERRGLILTEGPNQAPGRIRCVLTFFRPDPEHEERLGPVLGQIEGADNF